MVHKAPNWDPYDVEPPILMGLGDFEDMRTLEAGCGEGRLTKVMATQASFVLALDPDVERASVAVEELSSDPNVEIRPIGVEALTSEQLFDRAVFSWSLC